MTAAIGYGVAVVFALVGSFINLQDRLHFVLMRRNASFVALRLLVPVSAAIAVYATSEVLVTGSTLWLAFSRGVSAGIVSVAAGVFAAKYPVEPWSPTGFYKGVEGRIKTRTHDALLVQVQKYAQKLERRFNLYEISRLYWIELLRGVDNYPGRTPSDCRARNRWLNTFVTQLASSWPVDVETRAGQYSGFIFRLLRSYNEVGFVSERLAEASRLRHPWANRKTVAKPWPVDPPPWPPDY